MDEYNIQDTAENGEVPEAESLPENEGEFTLKHLDRTLSVDRDEVIRLAQKGLDYDRVKSRYSELKERGADAEQEAPEAQETEAQTAENEETARDTEHGDFAEFIDKRPDVSPGDIPREVWREVAEGKSLLTAYTLYENEKLRAELLTERQNRENRETSVESRSSEGSGLKLGELERLWYAEG